MVLLGVAHFAVAVAAHHDAFLTVSAAREVVELQATPIRFATTDAPRVVAAQAFQGSLLTDFSCEFIFQLSILSLTDDPVDLLEGLYSCGVQPVEDVGTGL